MRRKVGTRTVVLWHEPGWIHQHCLEREQRRETNSFVVLFYRLLNDPKPIRADGVSDDTHLPLIYICLIFSVSVSHCPFTLPCCMYSSCQSGPRGALIKFFLLCSITSSIDILGNNPQSCASLQTTYCVSSIV